MSTLFDGTHTSRRSLIFGMTNTNQIGMQQAKAPAAATVPDHAERLDDAGDGGSSEDGGDVNDATGLSAEDQALFDQMARGGPLEPEGDTPEPADGEGDDNEEDAGDDANPESPPIAAPLGKEKTPAELAAEAVAGKKPAETVSRGKYQRELKKANEATAAAQTEARKAREDAIKLAERVAIINEALTAQPAVAVDPNAPPANPFEEADIDPEVDYSGSVKQIQRRQRFQMEQNQRVEQDVVESREDRDMRDTFTRDFQSLASRPEGTALPQAYQFLKDSRLTEICISEFDKDPNDPNEIFTEAEVAKMVQMFNAEEKWVVGNAIKQGKSPAAAIMKLARARGFKATAQAAAAAPAAAAAAVPAVRNGTGRAVVPAAPTAADQIAALAAAQAAGKSLSDGGGAPPTGLTAQILLDMEDDEFADLIDGLPKHQLDALMGRAAG